MVVCLVRRLPVLQGSRWAVVYGDCGVVGLAATIFLLGLLRGRYFRVVPHDGSHKLANVE